MQYFKIGAVALVALVVAAAVWTDGASPKPDKPTVAAAGGPPTGPGDPYSAGQETLGRSEYEQRKVALLSSVWMAQHAYRCRVIQMVEAQLIFTTGINRLSQADIDAGRSDYHPELLPAAKTAALEADAKAKESGACDFWRTHPEAVAEMRRQANLATQ